MPHPLSLAASTLRDCEPEEIVDLAAVAGFDSVGLHLTAEPVKPERLISLRVRAADLGLDILDVEGIQVTDDLELDDAERIISGAALLGVSAINVSGDFTNNVRASELITAIARRCADQGLVIGVEFRPWATPRDIDGARELVEECPAGAAMTVDLLHLIRAGHDVIDLLSVPPELITYAQICDARTRMSTNEVDLRVESEERRMFPGSGSLPLLELVEALPDDLPLSVDVSSARLIETLKPEQRARWAMKSTKLMMGEPLSNA